MKSFLEGNEKLFQTLTLNGVATMAFFRKKHKKHQTISLGSFILPQTVTQHLIYLRFIDAPIEVW